MRWLGLVLVIGLKANCALAAEPALTIQMGDKTLKFSAQDLLKQPGLRVVKIPADPAYNGQPKEYRAIPAVDLFKDFAIPPDGLIVFHCLDGFSGPLSKDDLLGQSPKQALALIAVEDPNAKWKPLKSGSPATPGPFYLIWQNPEKSKIGREQWPFQLASLEIKPSLAKQFPQLSPSTAGPSIQAGFRGFIKNCFACHTLNGEGTSHLGPDLNLPFSPTDYMNEKYLRMLIRDPQSMRRWPEAKMKGFSEKDLSNQELSEIIAYLRHMAKRRGSL